MNRWKIILLALAVIALVVAGCMSPSGPAPATPRPSQKPLPVTSPVPPTSPMQPFRGDWSLVTMASQAGTFPQTPAGVSLSINASADELSGNGGCNNYYAPYQVNGSVSSFGNSITVGPIISTKMYCTGTSANEGTYFSILQDTRAFAGDETHLTFTDSSHNTLVFDRPGAVPTATSLPQYP